MSCGTSHPHSCTGKDGCTGNCGKSQPASSSSPIAKAPVKPPKSEPIVPSLDAVTTIRDDGSRRFVHPSNVTGPFTRWRSAVGLLLLAIYVALPWIYINGYPAVFMDVLRLQFHFFGLTFLVQDMWLGFFLLTGLGFALFYVTALIGRVWCGWACPQTVFLDMARRIERWFEGDAPARRRLDTMPWTAEKTLRRGGAQLVMALFAFAVAHVFLSYFVSLPELYRMMTHAPRDNWGVFLFVTVVTAALWFDLAWFREQFCIIMCPYGRIQSALTDDNTMVIGYDAKRGEPRGRKGTTEGDCVDCRRCVQVCPTGIDIRQGLQLECIGCAACIDACADVMLKLERPTGLIRYDSLNGLQGKKRRIIRPRIIVYTVLLVLGVIVMLAAFSGFRSATATLVRLAGPAYFLDGEHKDSVRNQFILRVLNKRNEAETIKVEVVNPPATLDVAGIGESVTVPPTGDTNIPLILRLPRKDFAGDLPLTVRVRNAAGNVVVEKKLTFLGPLAHAP
jgi:cytochrome c oxidase accessory protein FixG